MKTKPRDAVTGAFGYSGKYIAKRLLARGSEVVTLTNSVSRKCELTGLMAYPLNFNDPDALSHSLEGVDVLYNTYWVRFNHKLFCHADAVRNTKVLFDAAKRAGVRKVVHVSITNPAHGCGLEYFEGKAELEDALIQSGLSYTIIRPAVIFGREDILINNIAWFLRHLPIFGVPGDGQYRLQPIHVEDLASLAVNGGDAVENSVVQAIGPDTFTFKDMIEQLANALGVRCRVFEVTPRLAYWTTRCFGMALGDVILTREEIVGLMRDYLHVDAPPSGKISLLHWAADNAAVLGRCYASELKRRRNREVEYVSFS